MTQVNAFEALIEGAYAPLINQVLAETNRLKPTASSKLTTARRALIRTAIARGADLDRLPERMAPLSRIGLSTLSGALSDKGLAEGDRLWFGGAASQRTPAMEWNNLFPAGVNDMILPFPSDAKAAENRVARLPGGAQSPDAG